MKLFLSGVRKLRRRAATIVTFGLLGGLLTLIIIAVATTRGGPGGGGGGGPRFDPMLLVTFPAAYELVLSFILQIGGLFALIFGAAIAGSEWSWGTLKSAVARGESRSWYMLSLFAAIAVVTTIGLLVTFLIGVAAAVIGASIAGIPLDGLGDLDAITALGDPLVRGLIGIITQGALGFAIATLARSQLAGIGAGIGLYLGGAFATIFLPDVVRYLPAQLASAAVGASTRFGGGQPTVSAVAPDVAVVLLIVWLVGSLVVALGYTQRAEITG
ncbi:MAG: hypothetical protein QOJ81_230 [Chloroflexota bacterium]|jgi:ABC-type transport system involved in multi-copper enzyme maturation permease subunit|nr:hypothetical protein [Chloroflexota bacterium]